VDPSARRRSSPPRSGTGIGGRRRIRRGPGGSLHAYRRTDPCFRESRKVPA
jgi:hypothetical protein